MKRAAVLLLALIALPLLAADKRFSLEDILGAPFVSDLHSAAGRITWIANERGARNVWVAEGPAYEPRQLTKFAGDEGIDLGELTISRDGSWIAFTRGGDLEIGSEGPNPASLATPPEQDVWTISRDGAVRMIGEGRHPSISPRGDRLAFEAKKQLMLAPLDGSAKPEALITAAGAREFLRWSPDGTKIAFFARRKEHAFVGVVDVATKSIRYLDPGVDTDVAPVWLPDSKHVAFIRIATAANTMPFTPARSAQPWSIRVADATTGVGRELWRADSGRGSAFRQTESDEALWVAGDHLVFPWEKDGWLHLYSIPLAGGGAPRLLTPGEFEVQHISADGASILYSSNQDDIDRRHIWRVAADGSSKPAAITSGKTIEWSPVPVSAKTVAFIRSDATHPGRVFLNERAVTALGPAFPTDLVEPQQVIFGASDGMPIHGQLFLPHDGAAKHPAVVFFHGGSQRQMLLGWHYMDYYSNAYSMNQYLASRGYVVLAVNYRSGIGYGLNFREALNYGAGGASEVNDVTGAALYLRTRSDVDPARIMAWGGSYGGYLTAFALAKSSDLYAGGVDLHGVHDWNEEIKVWVASYDPAKNESFARLAKASSPIAYVDTWRSPVLLIQGDDDRNVAFTETIHLAEELRKRNVHVETLVFPDEIHDFLLHRNWLAAYHATEEFLGRVPSITTPASAQ